MFAHEQAERSIRTLLGGRAYGAIYRSSTERTAALTGWLDWSRGARIRRLSTRLTLLGLPGMPPDGVVTIPPLIPVGLGLGMLFVPTSRAALNATPLASHGRTSALLSVGRLLGATVGAGLAGLALSGTLTAATVHRTFLLGAILCVVVGLPAATRLTARAARPASQATTA